MGLCKRVLDDFEKLKLCKNECALEPLGIFTAYFVRLKLTDPYSPYHIGLAELEYSTLYSLTREMFEYIQLETAFQAGRRFPKTHMRVQVRSSTFLKYSWLYRHGKIEGILTTLGISSYTIYSNLQLVKLHTLLEIKVWALVWVGY